MNNLHSFHLPVMGIGFTIDTPIKIAHYGIDSVIFIGDDHLLEKMRIMYSKKMNKKYSIITKKDEDYKAKRVSAYLNLVKEIVEINFNNLINNSFTDDTELKKYFRLLPKHSTLEDEYNLYKKGNLDQNDRKNWLKNHLKLGAINVNIMTKLDKVNYKEGKVLPIEFNDAHATLRGFANSHLNSSVIFSAGMNPHLYSYLEQFEDFYPNKEGIIKKRIVLKVSDYRSALIQGKFLAKKGIWVSEYRIESGLNCGGHAFATEGYLMGPILQEFKEKRPELTKTVYDVLIQSLKSKERIIPKNILDIQITAQGGIGTTEEHQYLINEFNLNSIGWGSPFLLVPEVTNVDEYTIQKLSKAKEKDLYLSNISPLGVPFNNLRENSKDLERIAMVDKGKPGSTCPKEILALNNEFTKRTICTASKQYQRLKIKELNKQENMSALEYKKTYNEITEKTCICVGLGTTALINNKIDHKIEGNGVSVCPGPNMAYYSKISSLQEMTNHIYGKDKELHSKNRPHVFIKEMKLYLDFLENEIKDASAPLNRKEKKHFNNFTRNLLDGIIFYTNIFEVSLNFKSDKENILEELNKGLQKLTNLKIMIDKLIPDQLTSVVH